MSNESNIMHQLAQAIDTLEKMVGFMDDAATPSPDKLTMAWSWGSATLGYRELQRAIEAVAVEMWPQLRDEAIRRQGLEVERLRVKLAEEQGRVASERSEPPLL